MTTSPTTLTFEIATYRRHFADRYAEIDELLADLPAEALLWKPFDTSPWQGAAGQLGWLIAHAVSSAIYLLRRAEWTMGRREWKAIIEANHNSPSIVCWVPFNEGWGQFQTNEILAWTKELDPTRLVDGPSGWTDRGAGDMHDVHIYPGPGMPKLEDKRAAVLGCSSTS